MQTLGFKAAFSQTSGVAFAGSDFYALPRFAFNEHYGTLNRFKLITQLKPLRLRNIIPHTAMLTNSPRKLFFTLADNTIIASSLRCYYQGKSLPLTIDKTLQATVTLDTVFAKGRNKINCTAQDKNSLWHWSGLFYILT